MVHLQISFIEEVEGFSETAEMSLEFIPPLFEDC